MSSRKYARKNGLGKSLKTFFYILVVTSYENDMLPFLLISSYFSFYVINISQIKHKHLYMHMK
jgi:hypothetical protein